MAETDISAAQVKELREATGAGMMECKKALVEADADMDKAIDVLRTRGLAAAAKKAGRATDEGRIGAFVSDSDARVGSVIEVDCETDFVAINEKFTAYTDTFARAVADNDPADIDALKASSVDGKTVDEILTDAIHVIGENIQIARFARLQIDGTGALVPYIHMDGKIGVLVGFTFNNEATATDDAFLTMGKDVAMQIAATNPVSLDQSSVPDDVVAHEKDIYKAQAAESGKPEDIQEKMATGRMKKFYKENCLVEQDFVKDTSKTVESYVAEVAKAVGDDIKVVTFARMALGEE